MDSRQARRRIPKGLQPHFPRENRDGRQKGVALVMAIVAIAMLTALIADLQERTATAYAVGTAQRDRLKAEYMARSGLNLTRLLIAREPQVRQVIAPLYQSVFGRPPPMLPIWNHASLLLRPFCEYETSRGMNVGIDFGNAQGLGTTDAMCEVNAYAENSKINVNMPLTLAGNQAKRSLAMNLFAMMGGYHSPSPFDPIFSERDPDGQFSNRQDVLSALIDWWDYDTQRTNFDPGRAEVTEAGSEEDLYRRLDEPYDAKNAPFDSLEELRMVRGISDDFWATFIEPRPDRPQDRTITIYGSGLVNANEAPPEVLLARLCSFIEREPLCSNPVEAAKFVQLMNTARALIPVPFFGASRDFINFVEGRGGPRDIYPMLRSFLGEENPLLFTPVQIPADARGPIDRSFVTAARIIAIDVHGYGGCLSRESENLPCEDWRSTVRLNTVMNFHDLWTPPPPNAGRMPGLGIFHYYRMD